MRPLRIPKSIAYLAPYIRELEAVDEPELLAEFGELNRLCELLKDRIKGLQRAKAIDLLDSDREALASVLSENEGHPAHVVVAFMLQTQELVDFLKKRGVRTPPAMDQGTPRGRARKQGKSIEISVPAKLNVRRDGPTGLCIEGPDFFAVVDHLKGPSIDKLVDAFREDGEYEIEDVTFGDLHGVRLTRDDQIRYLLQASDARYQVILAQGKKGLLEPSLKSLRTVPA